MDNEAKVAQELRDLNQKVVNLEKLVVQHTAKDKAAGPVRILSEAIISTLFGLLVLGPVVAVVYGIFLIASSY